MFATLAPFDSSALRTEIMWAGKSDVIFPFLTDTKQHQRKEQAVDQCMAAFAKSLK